MQIIDTYQNKHNETFRLCKKDNGAFVLQTDDPLACDYEYPVIDGECFLLVLSDDEQTWLKNIWNQIGCETSLYGDGLELIRGKKCCALNNNICPLCLERKSIFENHHCIWKVNGGLDSPKNLLRICKTCHLIITGGDPIDSAMLNMAAQFHQAMLFGIRFYPHTSIVYAEKYPQIIEYLHRFAEFPKEKRNKINNLQKRSGRYFYQYYRDTAKGLWDKGLFQELAPTYSKAV